MQPPLTTVLLRGLPAGVIEELRSWHRRDARWPRWLVLYTGRHDEWPADRPAMWVDYEIEGDAIRVRPRYPLKTGLDYTARFDGPPLALMVEAALPTTRRLERLFLIPEPISESSTEVVAVYPSSMVVPDNLLRLYVHFSAPMQRRDVHRFVRLLDSADQLVELPFVEIENGLWDPDGKRLTLLLHPGRIKRGVGPNMAMGPPLRQGETYRLIIDREFSDANGFSLASGFEKTIEVTAADRAAPDPTSWTVTPPGSAGDSLVVEFPEPLDEALLHRLLAIESAQGEPVAGSIEVAQNETLWRFRPAEPWQPGGYFLWIHPALEDLAGNRIDGLFETSGAAVTPTESVEPIEIAFWLEF